jgi:hypothetical protein
MVCLVDFLYRCFYNLVSKRQPPPLRVVSAQATLWLFSLLATFNLYSLLVKILIVKYLLLIMSFVFAGFYGIIVCLLRYFTRPSTSNDASYHGTTGKLRVGCALLGVLFFPARLANYPLLVQPRFHRC